MLPFMCTRCSLTSDLFRSEPHPGGFSVNLEVFYGMTMHMFCRPFTNFVAKKKCLVLVPCFDLYPDKVMFVLNIVKFYIFCLYRKL